MHTLGVQVGLGFPTLRPPGGFLPKLVKICVDLPHGGCRKASFLIGSRYPVWPHFGRGPISAGGQEP